MDIITEYKVVEANSLEVLIRSVNLLIAQGWTPQGGICEAGTESFLFFQAMIFKIQS